MRKSTHEILRWLLVLFCFIMFAIAYWENDIHHLVFWGFVWLGNIIFAIFDRRI